MRACLCVSSLCRTHLRRTEHIDGDADQSDLHKDETVREHDLRPFAPTIAPKLTPDDSAHPGKRVRVHLAALREPVQVFEQQEHAQLRHENVQLCQSYGHACV